MAEKPVREEQTDPWELTSQILYVPGSLPGMNKMIGAAHSKSYHVYSNMKRKYTELVAACCKEQAIGPYTAPIKLRIQWIEPNKRRDLDNIAAAKKFILDGLVMAGVIPNDGWKHVLGWEESFEIGEPMVRIEILEA